MFRGGGGKFLRRGSVSSVKRFFQWVFFSGFVYGGFACGGLLEEVDTLRPLFLFFGNKISEISEISPLDLVGR